MPERKIIFASSNQSLIEEITEPLRKFGYTVHICRNGESAFEKIKKVNPAAVLADLLLPGISGVELCWLLREKENRTWLPVIIFSAQDNHEIKLNCYRSGVDVFLTTPVSVRELIIRLESLLRRTRQTGKTPNEPSLLFSGEIKEFPLPELVQFLHNSKKTGQLWISHQYDRGSICFENGNICSARTRESEGEPAIFEIFNWQKGQFQLIGKEICEARNVAKETMEILLEYSKRQDEKRVNRFNWTQ